MHNEVACALLSAKSTGWKSRNWHKRTANMWSQSHPLVPWRLSVWKKKHWSSEFFIKIWCHVQMKYTVWRLSKWTKWSEVQKRTTWWGVSRPFVAVTYFAARAHSHQPCSSPTLSSRIQIHWNNCFWISPKPGLFWYLGAPVASLLYLSHPSSSPIH